MDIDALQIAKSLSDFAGNICGIVPQFRGRCFDITFDSAEAAASLAQAGYDHGDIRKPLKLSIARSIHMSIFVSVEFPDEELLNLLATYGALKTRHLRRLHFPNEGIHHIENGVRVAEFSKINCAIPKRIVMAGIEVGFKYSGQPVTCYRCQSTEDMVRNCPKKKAAQPLTNQLRRPPRPTWTPPPPLYLLNPSHQRLMLRL